MIKDESLLLLPNIRLVALSVAEKIQFDILIANKDTEIENLFRNKMPNVFLYFPFKVFEYCAFSMISRLDFSSPK